MDANGFFHIKVELRGEVWDILLMNWVIIHFVIRSIREHLEQGFEWLKIACYWN